MSRNENVLGRKMLYEDSDNDDNSSGEKNISPTITKDCLDQIENFIAGLASDFAKIYR